MPTSISNGHQISLDSTALSILMDGGISQLLLAPSGVDSVRAIVSPDGVASIIASFGNGTYTKWTSADSYVLGSSSTFTEYSGFANDSNLVELFSPVDPNAAPTSPPGQAPTFTSTPTVNPLLAIPVGADLAPADADGMMVPDATGIDMRGLMLSGLPWANRQDQAVPLKQLVAGLNLANDALNLKISRPEAVDLIEGYNYQTAPQVQTSIATEIAKIDFGNRRASVPAKYYYRGSIAGLQSLLDAPDSTLSLGVSSGDDLDDQTTIDSLALIEDPATGLFTIVQNQSGGLTAVNPLFFLNMGNIGSAFFIRENIPGQPIYAGKAFVVTNADDNAGTIEAVLDPDRQMNSAGDAVAINIDGKIDVLVDGNSIVIDSQNRLTLADSVKTALGKIPGMETSIGLLESAITRIDATLGTLQQQLIALSQRMFAVEGDVADLGARTTTLETAQTSIVDRLNGLFNGAIEMLLIEEGGVSVAKYRNAAGQFVDAISAGLAIVSQQTENFATYTIVHGLGQRVVSAQYWDSDASGAMNRIFTAPNVKAQTVNSFQVSVLKTDRVLVQIPVTAKALAPFSV